MLRNLLLLAAAAGLASAVSGVTHHAHHDSMTVSDRCPLMVDGARRVSGNNELFVRCFKPIAGVATVENIDWVWGVLDLGKCFANRNGIVVPELDGKMSHTCEPCKFEGETTNMVCRCKAGKDEWIESENELNDRIWINDDGLPCCKGSTECGDVFDEKAYGVAKAGGY